MTNSMETYRVVGKTVKDDEISKYCFIDSKDNTVFFDTVDTVYLAYRGQIENMTVRTSGNDLILRGKGINLNKLPIYNEDTGKYSGSKISAKASGGVSKHIESDALKMGQFELVKRVMFGNKCIGYMFRDISGKTYTRKRDVVIQLALQCKISNAEVNKFEKSQPDGSTKTCLILRGVNVDLRKLPVITVDKYGKVVSSTENKDVVRATIVKRGGVVLINNSDNVIRFKAGDFVIINKQGRPEVVDQDKFNSSYTLVKGVECASSDYMIENVKDYAIELFGGSVIRLTPDLVKSWAMVKIKD